MAVEFWIVLEQDPGTEIWVAGAPGVDGAYSHGATKPEAIANLREVFELLRMSGGIPTQPPVALATLRIAV